VGSIPTRVIRWSPCTDTPEGYISLVTISRHSHARLASAFAAVIALLVAPVRPVLECTMPAAESATVAASGADEHAGHAMPAGVPADESAPAHDVCPDLAHCVTVAPLAVGARVDVASALRVLLQTPAAAQPASATSALEPPPPK
jgi:hypothetical protein